LDNLYLAILEFSSDKQYQTVYSGDYQNVKVGDTVYIAGAPEKSDVVSQRAILVKDGKIENTTITARKFLNNNVWVWVVLGIAMFTWGIVAMVKKNVALSLAFLLVSCVIARSGWVLQDIALGVVSGIVSGIVSVIVSGVFQKLQSHLSETQIRLLIMVISAVGHVLGYFSLIIFFDQFPS
jgi:hypothetical protein